MSYERYGTPETTPETPNPNQFQSIPINSNQFQPIPTNSNQFHLEMADTEPVPPAGKARRAQVG